MNENNFIKKIVTGMAIFIFALFMACETRDFDNDKTSENDTIIQTDKSEKETTTKKPNKETTTKKPNNDDIVEIGGLDASINIEETVIYDKDNVKISAKDIKYTKDYLKLNLLIENDSDKDLSFVSGSIGYSCNSINGYMVTSGYLWETVVEGKKLNASISFDIDELMLYGITEISDISIGFQISNKDWSNSDEIYTGPLKVKTSIADRYDYSKNTYAEMMESGRTAEISKAEISYGSEKIYGKNGVEILSYALVTNQYDEQSVLLEIRNNSDEMIYGNILNININGLIISGGIYDRDSINPNSTRVMDVSLSSILKDSYVEAFGISEIGEFTFDFVVEDSEHDEIAEEKGIDIMISETAAKLDMSGEELFNEKGIKIISKGIFPDSSKYSNNVHMFLLIENTSSKRILVDDVYNSLAVNGFMTNFSFYSMYLDSDKCGIIDVKIYDDALEKNGIEGIEEINEIEITFEIKDKNYKDICKPTVKVKYK